MSQVLNPAVPPSGVLVTPFGTVTKDQLEELEYFQRRYKEEREKRLRPDGLKQYANVATTAHLSTYWEDPWVQHGTPVNNPIPNNGSTKLLILGAGAAGILQAVQCIKAGLSADDICLVDVAAGFGGAWYWNRYPGAACDVESYCYMPMLEEMEHIPSRKFSPAEEFRCHYERIATKYDLQRRAMWQTWANTADWNDQRRCWDLSLTQKPKGLPKRDISIHADFVVMAAGLQSIPKMPTFPGIDRFKGHMFHASRWDYDCTGGSTTDQQLWGLVGKRVGMIGNAASGGQAIVEVAKYASEVFMFQRTPARVHPKPNPPTDIDEWNMKIANKPGWQDERNRNYHRFLNHYPEKPKHDDVDDSHTKLVTFCGNFGTPRTITPELAPAWMQHLNLVDVPLLKSVHAIVEKKITDPIRAEKLKAWFPVWCKRPLLPNVHVIDTNGNGVDSLTDTGVVAAGQEYPVDVIIMATGFQSPWGSPDAKVNMKITGVHGLKMGQKWDTGMTTLHGVVSRGFPNLFWPGPSQSSILPANTFALEGLAKHIAAIISKSSQTGAALNQKPRVQPTATAEDSWGNRVASMMPNFASAVGCTPSLTNGEGDLEKLKDSLTPERKAKMAKLGMWGRGVDDYLAVLEAWRNEGSWEGLEQV